VSWDFKQVYYFRCKLWGKNGRGTGRGGRGGGGGGLGSAGVGVGSGLVISIMQCQKRKEVIGSSGGGRERQNSRKRT